MIEIIKSQRSMAGHCSECKISLDEALGTTDGVVYIVELGTEQSFYSHRLCQEHFDNFSLTIRKRLAALQS